MPPPAQSFRAPRYNVIHVKYAPALSASRLTRPGRRRIRLPPCRADRQRARGRSLDARRAPGLRYGAARRTRGFRRDLRRSRETRAGLAHRPPSVQTGGRQLARSRWRLRLRAAHRPAQAARSESDMAPATRLGLRCCRERRRARPRSLRAQPSPPPRPLPANDADIAFAPVTQLSRWIEARQLTSERLTNIYLDRHASASIPSCAASSR